MATAAPALPITQQAARITRALAEHDVVVIVSSTGSGKTTQVPQILMDADASARVVVTQPRRVAAVTVAARVAEERGGVVGGEVGYAVRFDEKCSRGVTRVRYVTDGVLLREAMAGGLRYEYVVIDEVHERSVNTDVVLGVVREELERARGAVSGSGSLLFGRKKVLPFKVVVMSATTDARKIVDFFSAKGKLSVESLAVSGRLFPVDILYTATAVPDVIDGAVTAALQVHMDYPLPGDILAFLPGQDEILSAVSLLQERAKRYLAPDAVRNVQPRALFASLSPAEQLRAIEPLPLELRGTTRKVIFSTNVAETSITIPGVKYVIDSGLAKVRGLYSGKGVHADVLRVEGISKAQAEQRKGRAGRLGPGTVFRLYTEDMFNKMAQYPVPEILRADAAGSLLQIIALESRKSKTELSNGAGVLVKQARSFRSFPFVDKPPRRVIGRALESLIALGAVDDEMALTKTGELMARIPTGPMLARSLLESLRLGCLDSMLSLAAVLSAEGSVFFSPTAKRDAAKAAQRRFVSQHGDHLTLVNALDAYMEVNGKSRRVEFCRDHYLNNRTLSSAESIREQLAKLMDAGDMGSWSLANPLPATVDVQDAGPDELLRRCVVAGFFRNAARKRSEDGKYVLVGGSGGADAAECGVDIHPSSALRMCKIRRNPPLVVFDEYVMTTKQYLRTVVSVELVWLTDHSNNYFQHAH